MVTKRKAARQERAAKRNPSEAEATEESKAKTKGPAPTGMREKVKQGFLTPKDAMTWLVAESKKDGSTPSQQAIRFLRNRMRQEG